MAVARENLSLAVEVAASMRNFDGDSAGEGHVAFVVEQALAGEVNRDERGGARSLHVDAGAAQIELVGNTRGEDILIIAGLLELKQACSFKKAAVAEQVVDQIGVHARSGKDAYCPIKTVRRMAGVFQSFPCALHKMPVLRIHDGCVSRTQTKEGRIEHRDIVESRCRFDVIGVGQLFRRDAGGEEFGIGERPNRLDAVAQIPPEIGNGRSAGKAPRHANDRESGGRSHCLPFSAEGPTCGAVRDQKPGFAAGSLRDGPRVLSPWRNGRDR